MGQGQLHAEPEGLTQQLPALGKILNIDLAKGEQQSHVGVNALLLQRLTRADALPC